jgi:hypothetical protein
VADVRLDCPLCGAVAFEGAVPAARRCPGCGARFAGGGERPRDAAAGALEELGVDGGDADVLARALFDADEADRGVAITSDRRDGFYAWWIFVADSSAARALLAALARP